MCFNFWEISPPRPPTGAPPLDPAGGLPSPRPPRLCSSKISLKIPCLRLFRIPLRSLRACCVLCLRRLRQKVRKTLRWLETRSVRVDTQTTRCIACSMWWSAANRHRQTDRQVDRQVDSVFGWLKHGWISNGFHGDLHPVFVALLGG